MMPNISKLEVAKTRIRNSINAARDLLAKMTTATLHPVPISTHVKDIAKMTHLTYDVDIDLMETQPTCRDLNDMEIRDFSTSMIKICHRASIFYTKLSTRLDPEDDAKVLLVHKDLQVAMLTIQEDDTKRAATKPALQLKETPRLSPLEIQIQDKKNPR